MRNKILISMILLATVATVSLLLLKNDRFFPINVLLPTRLTQNAFNYIPPSLPGNVPLLTTAQQKIKKEDYLHRLFFPWSANNQHTFYYPLATATKPNLSYPIIKIEKAWANACVAQPCYNINYEAIHKIPTSIIKNMDLKSFPNIQCNQKNNNSCYGIIVANTEIRGLPTVNPLFYDPRIPGQGYPFDNLQVGEMWLGTPIQIIHQSKDRAWLLIKGQGKIGWVKSTAVAHTTKAYRLKWQTSKEFITPIQRRSTFYQKNKVTTIYLGAIYPLLKSTKNTLTIAIPQQNSHSQATIKQLQVNSNQFFKWPMKTTPNHFALLINQMLDMPYGWGGLNFDGDCSSTLKRIFSAVGIWLAPRALYQGEFAGKIAAISKDKRKNLMLNLKGKPTLIPYLTLITVGHQPNSISHVMLYLGTYKIQQHAFAIVFQTSWGIPIKTKKQQKNNKSIGRAIYGRAVITPLSEGNNLITLFSKSGLQLMSIWDLPEFNVTLLKQKPKPLMRFLH